MDEQHVTIALFIVAQLITIFLAIFGWFVATKLMAKQLERQHADSLRIDEERLRRDMTVQAVMELIRRLYEIGEISAKLAAIIDTAKEPLPRLPLDLTAREAYVKYVLHEFNSTWVDMQHAGLAFFPVFDSYEPAVHSLIPERDKLFYLMSKVINCRSGSAKTFITLVSSWLLDSARSANLPDIESALRACRTEFDAIRAELDATTHALRTKLQNEFLAPIFGHTVDPDRKIKVSLGPSDISAG